MSVGNVLSLSGGKDSTALLLLAIERETAPLRVVFAELKMLVTEEMGWWLAAPYIVGTVAGSLWGASISMRIERAIGAKP